MKTEPWPMEYHFAHAPRWDVNTQPRPLIVYLDQWCWSELTRDRAGEPQSPDASGLYVFLRDLALAGHVVFPLSQAHYLEDGARTNEDGRWDTAVVMAELSGFNTITARGLDTWEAKIAVAATSESTSTSRHRTRSDGATSTAFAESRHAASTSATRQVRA